uniref:Uncharacterized protein n=1 Tax=Helicotheca tamesis TaxID=374047 RepID=A0A7S2II40_9STRA|mmetsp:Transcript_932/g.1285  ORF Transcript_932/g.1285 Transcript_932/m.1285 type:complete len:254 (+) Transcript_932:3-764(+)
MASFILPGRAHVSERPFGTRPIWGWGNPWRDNREFVGRVSYGAVYKLWNPKKHLSFGDNFQGLTRSLFMCQRRWESPLSRLPDDCIFYILNMCRWDWANDTVENLRINKKRTAKRLKQQQEAEEQNAEESNDVSAVEALECSLAVADQDQTMESNEENENWDDDEEEEDDYAEDSDDPEWMEEDDEDSTEAAVFHYRDYDSDDSDEANEERLRMQELRSVSLGRLFPQLHILQALVRLNETDVMEINNSDETA